MRLLLSFFISLQVHALGIFGLPRMMWEKPEKRKPMEIALVKLPPEPKSVSDGSVKVLMESVPLDPTPSLSSGQKEESAIQKLEATLPAERRPVVSVPPRAEPKKEPTVLARVIRRLPEDEPKKLNPIRPAQEDSVEEEDLPAPVSRPAVAMRESQRSAGAPVPRAISSPAVSGLFSGARSMAGTSRVNEWIGYGGDPRPLVQIIQSRIDAIVPLVHAAALSCLYDQGLVRVQFRISAEGYPRGYQIWSSSGNSCLDAQVNAVLHLAEPYPYVAGWVPVAIRFER